MCLCTRVHVCVSTHTSAQEIDASLFVVPSDYRNDVIQVQFDTGMCSCCCCVLLCCLCVVVVVVLLLLLLLYWLFVVVVFVALCCVVAVVRCSWWCCPWCGGVVFV